MTGTLIRCRECNALFFPTPFDRSPELTVRPDGGTECVFRDDRARFVREHDGHELEELTITEHPVYSRRSYRSPVRISYFEATNGRETFLVKRWRKDAGEACRYDVLHESVIVTSTTLEIREREIRAQLHWEAGAHPPGREHIDGFISLLRWTVGRLRPDQLMRVYQDPEDPALSCGLLPRAVIEALTARCREIFPPAEADSFIRFIEEHGLSHVPLGVLVRREFQILRSEEEAPAAGSRASGDVA